MSGLQTNRQHPQNRDDREADDAERENDLYQAKSFSHLRIFHGVSDGWACVARPVRRAIVIDSLAAGSPLESLAEVVTSAPFRMKPSNTATVGLAAGDSTSPVALNLMQRKEEVSALDSGAKA